MIILHNVHDAASRDFVAEYGNTEGVTVYDFYNPAERQAWLDAGGTNAISAFPSVLLRHDSYEVETDEGSHTVAPGWDVVRKAESIDPLPNEGEWVARGIYSYNGGFLLCRQAHERTHFAPEDTPALFSVWRPDSEDMIWIPNEPVGLGDERIYDGARYEVIQAHTTQEDWTPPQTPALWAAVPDDEPDTDEWQANTAYSVNDEVTYQGTAYRCLQAHTSQVGWEPPAVPALWEPI